MVLQGGLSDTGLVLGYCWLVIRLLQECYKGVTATMSSKRCNFPRMTSLSVLPSDQSSVIFQLSGSLMRYENVASYLPAAEIWKCCSYFSCSPPPTPYTSLQQAFKNIQRLGVHVYMRSFLSMKAFVYVYILYLYM